MKSAMAFTPSVPTPVEESEGKGSPALALQRLFEQIEKIPSLAGRDAAEILREVRLFAHLTDEQLGRLAPGATIHQTEPNSVVIREGDYEETFFIILSGKVLVIAGAETPAARHLGSLGKGEFFGEMAALSGYPRSATVITAEPSLLLEVTKEAFLSLVDHAPSAKAALDQEYKARALKSQLQLTSLFQGVEQAVLDELAEKAVLKSFKKTEVVFREGDPGDSFYLVRNGFAKVSRWKGQEEFVLAYLKGGTFFGEMAILSDEPRSASVIAVTRLEVVQFSREEFLQVLRRYPNVEAKVRKEIEDRKKWQQKIQQNVTLAATLKGFVEGGVIGGRDVLMIDLKKCIRCYNCVRACREVHDDGHSRVNLKGIKVGSLLIATSCRHCYDPECMVCPIGAIDRDQTGRVEIKPHCMGIGKCVKGCPNGVISLVNVEAVKPKGHLAAFLDRFKKRRLPKLVPEGPQPAYLARRRRYSIKCDLCEGFPGPACMGNCPTGAAQRLNPEEYIRYLERAV
jgi:CRP-like cAMP-binding protein/Fe-S-cluster-containing hydrogenase component 2